MAILKTMVTLTRETQISTSATKSARTIGELIDQHLMTELRMMTDSQDVSSGYLSGLSLTFDADDADNLAAMYMGR